MRVLQEGETLAANCPSTLPGGSNSATTIQLPLVANVAPKPICVDAFQTSCVKWPVLLENTGLL